MFANGVLAVLVKRRRKPNDRAIGQRTKASVEVIEAGIDKFHRDDEAAEHFRDCEMRFDVGAELVAAKESDPAEESVAFTFEIIIVGQPRDLIAALFHPAREMRCFAGAFFVSKIAGNESFADREPGVGSENHVGKSRLRRDEIDFALE